jgi:hypothetical protein
MLAIEEIAGGQNMAGREIHLNFGDVTNAPEIVGVLAGGKLRDDVVVVFTIYSLEEPDSSFLNRAGEGEAWNYIVERNAAFQLSGGKKIGGSEQEVVIANASGDTKHTAGAFAVFGGDAAVLHLDRTDGVGTDTQLQSTVGGLSDVEAVEQSESLRSGSAGDVGLAAVVLNDAGDEVKYIAIVMRGRVGNIKDVETGDLLGGGRLKRIDPWGRFDYVHDFVDFLNVNQLDVDRRGLPWVDE